MRLGWNLPLERLSASSMGLMISCPEAFRVKYLAKEKPVEKMFSSRFLGIVDHKVSELMVKEKIASAPEQDVSDLYASTWNDVIERDGEPDWRDDDPVKMMSRGVKMAELYAREVLPQINPVASEERFEMKVPGVPATIIGYLDIIDQFSIRERKTTGVKTTKPKAKWRFQGLIYQLASGMPVQWDVITRQATPQVFTADMWPDLHLPLVSPKVATQLITDAAKRMNDLYSQYGSETPWPMEGMITSDWACDYCPIGPKYERTCLVWRQ